MNPFRASSGTVATIDVEECTPSVAGAALPEKCTTGEAPKPVPLIVTFAPPFAATGASDKTLGSPLNGLAVFVVPPALITAIGPSTAAAGTVTFNDIPPGPTENAATT